MRVVQGGSEWQPPDRQHEAPGLGTGGSIVVGNWLALGLGNRASLSSNFVVLGPRVRGGWRQRLFPCSGAVWDGHAVCHARDLGLRISRG